MHNIISQKPPQFSSPASIKGFIVFPNSNVTSSNLCSRSIVPDQPTPSNTSICFMKSCSRCAPALCRISESTGFSCLKKSASFFLAILVLANAACDNNLWAIS